MQAMQLSVSDFQTVRSDGRAHLPEIAHARLERQLAYCRERQRLDYRQDAVDTLIPARNVEQILGEIMRDSFGPRYSQRYIPMGPFGADAWAERIITRRITRRGLLDYVTSADMPWQNADAQEITHEVRNLGGKFGWGYFDLQRSIYANIPLNTELGLATRENAEDTKDLIMLAGDSGLPKGGGVINTGLINDSTVPVGTLGTGGWDTGATTAQIQADVAGLFQQYRTQSREAEEPDTMLLPEAEYAHLEQVVLPNTATTLKEHFQRVYEGLRIMRLPRLSTAGVGGVARGVLYARNDRVLRGIVPLDFTIVVQENIALEITAYGVMRLVGLVVRRPFGMLYFDGV